MSDFSHWVPLNLGQISKFSTNKWWQLNITVLSLFASLGKDLEFLAHSFCPTQVTESTLLQGKKQANKNDVSVVSRQKGINITNACSLFAQILIWYLSEHCELEFFRAEATPFLSKMCQEAQLQKDKWFIYQEFSSSSHTAWPPNVPRCYSII